MYKVLNNVSALETTLVSNETERAGQFIQYIEDDLENLIIEEYPDLPDSLSSQFSKVSSNIDKDQEQALEDLQKFQNDLLTLIDNL